VPLKPRRIQIHGEEASSSRKPGGAGAKS
jgi:hypothetical protein